MTPVLFDQSGLAAIYPGAFARVQAAYRLPHAAALVRRESSAPATQDGIAVIAIHGVIEQRGSVMSDIFGGTSLDVLQASLAAARDDRSVSRIVLHVDSPGGGVYGVDETAALIADVGKRKPVTAYVDGMAASAAYWLASAAERIVATASAEIGSVGVYAVHFDESAAFAQQGVVPTLIKAGEFKTEANPFQALSDEDRAAMQARIDSYYALFVKRVAKGRGVPVEDVRAGYGKGRVVSVSDALQAGMVDDVGTFTDVLRGISRETSRTAARAADVRLRMEAQIASVA